MIFCIIYFLTTFVVPAKATYHLLKDEHLFTGSDHLWAVYWAFYVFVSLLQCYLPFLQMYIYTHSRKTFEIIAMVFLVWLYHGNFKVLRSILRELCTLKNFWWNFARKFRS